MSAYNSKPVKMLHGSINRYDHSRGELRRRFCRFLLREIGFKFLARVDSVEGWENVPKKGAAILIINHIGFIDPVMMVHIVFRDIIPLAKAEVYKIPGWGIFPWLWGVIPVKREGVDRRAIQAALRVLEAGEIILVAPEGTRNPQMERAKEGAAYLASRSGASIIPVAIQGTIGFPSLPFLPRWNEPGVHVQFGRPFQFKSEFNRAGREQLRLMADEAMYILATMLPEHLRGFYRDLSKATQQTIEWL
ncbi:MAG: 1-acyl-sn-glycerol-3-phosphate acyltransferase [Anaerolineales bacterium]|nr:1-acyl-sn-glycerol-3-phosphate acyltransferase [Anaerolineales bacterium]